MVKSYSVPVQNDGTIKYVRLDDIPERYRAPFLQFMRGGQMPSVENDSNCFYVQDWENFVMRLT